MKAIPSEADSRNSLRGDPSQSREGHCLSVLEGEVLTFCALRRMRLRRMRLRRMRYVQTGQQIAVLFSMTVRVLAGRLCARLHTIEVVVTWSRRCMRSLW